MPKQIYTIRDFSGGMVAGADPRDIPDNASFYLTRLSTSKAGELSAIPSIPTIQNDKFDIDHDNANVATGPYGLCVFKHDRSGLGVINAAFNMKGLYDTSQLSDGYIFALMTGGSVTTVRAYDGGSDKFQPDALIGMKAYFIKESYDTGSVVSKTITDNTEEEITWSGALSLATDDIVVIAEAPFQNTEYTLWVNATTGIIYCCPDNLTIDGDTDLQGFPDDATDEHRGNLGSIQDGTSTSLTLKPVFIVGDGAVRVSDASHTTSVGTKYIGYLINEKTWGRPESDPAQDKMCDFQKGRWISAPSWPLKPPSQDTFVRRVQSWGRAGDYPNDDQGYFKHTGSDHSTIVTINNSANLYPEADELIGCQLYNLTDGSVGEITDNDTSTITVGGGLSGGSGNNFQANDVCYIYKNLNSTSRSKNGGLESVLPYFHTPTRYNQAGGAAGIKIMNNITAGGGWQGQSEYWMSYVYDGGQESLLTYLGDDSSTLLDGATNQKKKFNVVVSPMVLKHDASTGVYERAMKANGALTGSSSGWSKKTGSLGATQGDIWAYPPRVTGMRFYWSTKGDDRSEKWLLYEIDCKKGIKRGDADDTMGADVWYTMKPSNYAYTNLFGDGTTAPNTAHDNVIWLESRDQSDDFELFENPPKVFTYEQMSGLKYDEENICVQSFGCGVIANRRAYIGNVKILDEQEHGENHANNESNQIYEDLILKSLPGKFDTFPFKYGKLEVAINDGEKIIHLEEYNDRLLVFKESTLYIVNIAQDIEFLEATYHYKGVKSPASVTETDDGCVWVNTFGVYYFNGEKVINILESQKGVRYITEKMWADCINDEDHPGIAYNPEDRKVTVVNNLGPHTANSHGANTAQFIYDMKNQTWTTFTKFSSMSGTSDVVVASNVATDEEHGTHNEDSHYTNIVNATHLSSGDAKIFAYQNDKRCAFDANLGTDDIKYLKYLSKDIDFGDPNVRKKVYKVYVTYSCSAASQTNVTAYINGDSDNAKAFQSTSTNFSSSGFTSTGGTKWAQAELKPNVSSDFNNIYSMQLNIENNGTTATPDDFKINDISIVYRLKGVK